MAQINALCAELQKVAIDELGEVPSRIPEDLEALKLWIQQHPHLRARTDDQFLIQFLRGSKYSLERAKEKIDSFHALRSKYPDRFAVYNVDDKKLREIIHLGCFTKSPTPLNETGTRILIFRFKYNANKYSPDDLMRALSVLYEMIMTDDPYACVQGVTFIMDMALATTKHLLQVTPLFLQNIIAYFQKAVPLRIKSVFFVNIPPTVNFFFQILLPLISEKLRQRIHVCGSLDDLAKHMSLKYVPKDYGGENGLLDDSIKECELKLDDYREYFKENAQYGTDESLRPGAPLNFNAMFGTGGSFRKIAVD